MRGDTRTSGSAGGTGKGPGATRTPPVPVPDLTAATREDHVRPRSPLVSDPGPTSGTRQGALGALADLELHALTLPRRGHSEEPANRCGSARWGGDRCRASPRAWQ